MSKIEDGGPAFAYGNHEQGGSSGMTLRDWFAGQALAGITANPNTNGGPEIEAVMCEASYALADAMLAARSKDRSEP